MLPGPYSRSTNFRRWTNLTSIFLVIPFHLKQQAWVRVCVVTVVPITSCFIIPLTWCRRWLTTSAWNLSTIVSWSSSTLWALPGIQLNSWWVIPSLPLDELYYHRPLYCLPTNTSLFMFGVIPWVPCYPAIVLLYLGVLPSFMSRMFWDLFHLLRILDIEILLTITNSFLVPMLIPTSELCCLDSFLLATLSLWS